MQVRNVKTIRVGELLLDRKEIVGETCNVGHEGILRHSVGGLTGDAGYHEGKHVPAFVAFEVSDSVDQSRLDTLFACTDVTVTVDGTQMFALRNARAVGGGQPAGRKFRFEGPTLKSF